MGWSPGRLWLLGMLAAGCGGGAGALTDDSGASSPELDAGGDAAPASPDGAPLDGGAGDDGEPCDAVSTGPFVHVAPDGDDRGDCSAGATCRTLQRAAAQATAGTTVRVAAGTYRGFETVHPDVRWEAVGEVWIDRPPAGGVDDNIRIAGTDGVVLKGFRVKDAERAGIAVLDAADVVVCDNLSGPNGRWGIFTQYAPRVVIAGNETFGSLDEHGIYVSNSTVDHDAPLVRGNLVHDNHGNGIQLNGDCMWPGDGSLEDAVVEANVVRDNGGKGLSIIAAPGVLIANNLIHDNGPAAGGIHMTNEPGCTAEDASSAGTVVNNTVVEPDMAAFRATDQATASAVFNNIFVSPPGVIDAAGGNHIDHNLVVITSAGLFAAGYRLAPGSPARDAGVARFMDRDAPTRAIDGAPRPQGAAIDLGAHESPP